MFHEFKIGHETFSLLNQIGKSWFKEFHHDIKPNCFSIDQKVDMKKAKEILGGKVCVAGNVSPTGAFLSGTSEDVIREANLCIQNVVRAEVFF